MRWFDLEGKVAVVTGGSRGIGLEIARQLLEQKARVVIAARKPEGLEAARLKLQAAVPAAPADDLLTVPAHVADEAQVEKLFAAVAERFGRLDILVNNVGMNLATPSVVEADPAVWRKIIDTNLNGTYLCSRRAAALMKAQGGAEQTGGKPVGGEQVGGKPAGDKPTGDRAGGGRPAGGKIVNISSIAARQAAPAMGIYGVAKAAVEMLTKVLAVELAPAGIQVNAVAPCMVKTDFSAPFWTNEELHARLVATIPAGRLAEPADIAPVVLFLASSAADFITGQVLAVDGGSTAAWTGL